MIRPLQRFATLVGYFAASAYTVDVLVRPALAARKARKAADARGKPLISVVDAGGLRARLLGPTLWGDVNVEVVDDDPELPYDDKEFGALIASHVLEHMDDPIAALTEWERVADELFVVVPRWWAPHTWLHPGHRWVFLGKQKTGMRGLRLWQPRNVLIHQVFEHDTEA